MLIKLVLTRDQFAGLSDFIASDDNGDGLLKELYPELGPRFDYENTNGTFASLLKAAPDKNGNMETSILVSEFITGFGKVDVCQEYLIRLFDSIRKYQPALNWTRSLTLNGDDLPEPRKEFSELVAQGGGAEHVRMGKVLLEKRPDGKLYLNGVEVIRRPMDIGQQGKKFPTDIKRERLVNANVMDMLFYKSWLMPNQWWSERGKMFFRGTIFSDLGKRSRLEEGLYCGAISTQGSPLYRCYEDIKHWQWAHDSYEVILAE